MVVLNPKFLNACSLLFCLFPDATPKELKIEYCVSFWAGNITCYWDHVPETALPMTYTLHITEEAGRCRWDFGKTRRCVASRREQSCGIPVDRLFAFYKIMLTAENQLVQASSKEKCVHGMNIVKLSPPEVTSLSANQSRCFQLGWHLSGEEVSSAAEAQYQIGYRDLAEASWTQPLKPKEANGEILAYSLHLQREGQPVVPQCLTQDLRCTLLLQAGEAFTFFVTASNSVGTSPPTKLVVPPSGGQAAPPAQLPLRVSAAGDHSLLLQWTFPRLPRTSYVFEWGRWPRKPGDERCWHYHPGTDDHVVITEAIEAGYLYDVEIFALIDGNIWGSGSTTAYSEQIAPRSAPVLNPVHIWKSQVELQWDPIPLEECGGEIRNYTISYVEEGKDEQSAVVLDSSTHRYLIEGLAPGTVVQVYIVATNDAGSTNGAILSIHTKNDDYMEAKVLLLADIPEKQSPGYLSLTIGNLLRVLPSKEEGPDPKALIGNQQQAEIPRTWHKYPQPTPVIGEKTFFWKQGELPSELPGTWSEVEYARVVVIQKNNAPKESRVRLNVSLSKCQTPLSSCPGPKFAKGVWLQNLTYETLVGVGSHSRGPEVMGECPLLVGVTTGDVAGCESLKRTA
ncbi:UNVERIFIED_CONTAM: hypothetical protein K2H54_022456 [Gekko kuhli]